MTIRELALSEDCPKPYRCMAVWEDDATYLFAVFKTAEVKHIVEHTCGGDLAYTLTKWTEYYRGAGRAFGGMPHVRVGKYLTVVKQFNSQDV